VEGGRGEFGRTEARIQRRPNAPSESRDASTSLHAPQSVSGPAWPGAGGRIRVKSVSWQSCAGVDKTLRTGKFFK